ncbi:MAG: M20/M25/M40 family metallo-hydrolase [Planctomycetota bacterium]|jgi:hypothetical protein
MPRPVPKLVSRGAFRRLAALALGLLVVAAWAWFTMIRMPGESWSGPLPPMTDGQVALADELRRHVQALAGDIGPRSVPRPRALAAAAAYIESELAAAGYAVRRECYDVDGVECCNVEATLAGGARADEIVVIGAHYDSVTDGLLACPGANDNASGVAATLSLARAFADASPARTIRFVLFVNEEPPWFQTAAMGSLVHARACRERGDRVTAMLSLETIGCFLDEPGSQRYPPPFSLFYPSTGDFIAFVGNVASRRLVRRTVRVFRARAAFPSEGAAVPGWITGIGWSDHWAFWQQGYPALMVTDTAPFRYPHYHLPTDTPDRLDYDRMARVVDGLRPVLADLAGTATDSRPPTPDTPKPSVGNR